MAKRVKSSDFTKCDVCGIEVKIAKLNVHKLKCHMDAMQKISGDSVFEMPDGVSDETVAQDFNVDEFLGNDTDE